MNLKCFEFALCTPFLRHGTWEEGGRERRGEMDWGKGKGGCGKRERKGDGGGEGEGIGGMERCEGNVGVMDGRERWERESGGRAGRESWERNMRGRDGRESKITWIMVSQC